MCTKKKKKEQKNDIINITLAIEVRYFTYPESKIYLH